ncbi:MAG: hypothetical protein ACOYZ6_18975 [Chloroflexota bacterium]
MQKSTRFASIYFASFIGICLFIWAVYSFIIEAKSLETKYLFVAVSISLSALVWIPWISVINKPALGRLKGVLTILLSLLYFILFGLSVWFRYSNQFLNLEITALIFRMSLSWMVVSSSVIRYTKLRSSA